MDTSGNIRHMGPTEVPRQNEVRISEEQVRILSAKSAKKRKNWMRNQLCPCKSGKKFKRCCWTRMSKSAQRGE